MSVFPENIPPGIPYSWAPRFLTKIGGPYEVPVLDSRICWPYPQMVTNLTWPKRVTPNADYVALYDFFVSMRGRATAFTFYDFNNWKSSPIGMQWNHVLIGVRNGTTTVYDLPGKNMTSILVYDSGAPTTPLTLTTDYAISAGTGTDGRDKVTFTAGGTAGHVVDISFVGRLGMNVHFTADEMNFDTFYTSVQARGLAIEQVYGS
jgi:hypothetical protein